MPLAKPHMGICSSDSLKSHDHPCLIYGTQDELVNAFVPYLRSGLLLGERCVYFIHENSREFVIEAMEAGGFNLQPYLDNNAFLIISTQDAHLKEGYFEEQKMLAYWSDAILDAERSGFTGLRAAVEMTWATSGHPGCEILIPYESRLNNFTRINSVSVICQYRRQKFTPEQVRGIIHAHPIVIANNEILDNPAFIPPPDFIEGDAAMEAQALLDNLTLIKRLQIRTIELATARDEAIRANKLKSQFVANIGHEIRTPMNGVLGIIELLLDMEIIEGEVRDLIETAHIAAIELMTVVDDLLDFSKLEAGKVKKTDNQFYISAILDEITDLVSSSADKKGLSIKTKLDNELSDRLLIGDAKLIKQVILNLVQNAIKFTDIGSISVQVNILEKKADSVIVDFRISDTGIGISETQQKDLFQPFVQADGSSKRKYGGTGLGLSICRGYVTLMGGKIGLTSKENEGSSFWFSLPLKLAGSTSSS